MKIYIAATFREKDKAASVAQVLRADEIEVTSRWHDLPPMDATLNSTADTAERNILAAKRDIEDVERADLLMVFTGPPISAGRSWETGYAFAEGKMIIIIGPRECVFHYLPGILQFDTLDAWRLNGKAS